MGHVHPCPLARPLAFPDFRSVRLRTDLRVAAHCLGSRRAAPQARCGKGKRVAIEKCPSWALYHYLSALGALTIPAPMCFSAPSVSSAAEPFPLIVLVRRPQGNPLLIALGFRNGHV